MASRTSTSDPKQIGSRGKAEAGQGFDRRYAKARARKKPRITRISR